MPRASDPTEPIRRKAAAFPEVAKGTSCNQSSFNAGKGAFLYIGPGPKGEGWKAMFKLERSMAQVHELAASEPARSQIGSTGWVTARFTAASPLPRTLWEEWLKESYELACDPGTRSKPARKKAKRQG